MDLVNIEIFGGKVPRLSSKRLPKEKAQIATNCDLRTTQLSPMKDFSSLLSIGTSVWKTIYKYGTNWLYWTQDVDVVQSLVNVTTDKKKIFYTGDGYPKQTTTDLMSVSGNPSSTSQYRRLGIAAPVSPLNVTIQGAGDGETKYGAVSYAYTYVVRWADGSIEESAPSPASAVISLEGGQYISVSNISIPTLAATGNDITHVRLYRLEATSASAEYQMIPGKVNSVGGTEYGADDDYLIPITPTSVFDCNTANNDINTASAIVLQTDSWLPPPDTLQGLRQFQNGILVGFKGNELWFSEPWIPYAWPEEYMLTVDSNIVSIEIFDGNIVVTTEKSPALVSGNDPNNMVVVPLSYSQSCTSKRGTISTKIGVIYPSPDGLFLVDGNGGRLLTKNIYTKEQWQGLTPANLVSFYYDDRYYGFFEGTGVGIVLDFTERNDVIDVDVPDIEIHGGYQDPVDDALCLLLNRSGTRSIEEFEGSNVSLTNVWKSPIHELSQYICPPYARIIGNQHSRNPVIFNLWADGVLIVSDYVSTSNNAFRLPSGYRAREFEIQLSSEKSIDSVSLLTSLG